MGKWVTRLFCKHVDWDIQPTYTLLYYDRCKRCGKLRKTIGEIDDTYFKLGEYRIK